MIAKLKILKVASLWRKRRLPLQHSALFLRHNSQKTFQSERSQDSEPPSAQEELPDCASDFCATWRVSRTDNYDKYLSALGLGYLARKAMLSLNPEPTFSIVDGALHAVTPGIIGQPMRDDYSTGQARTVYYAGIPMHVEYSWEHRQEGTSSLELVAHCQCPALAEGRQFKTRRFIDDVTGELVLTSTVHDVSYTRYYRRCT